MAGLSLADWDEVGDIVEQALWLPDPARDTLLREVDFLGYTVEEFSLLRQVVDALPPTPLDQATST